MAVDIYFRAHPLEGGWTHHHAAPGQTAYEVVAPLATEGTLWTVQLTRAGETRVLREDDGDLVLEAGDELRIAPNTKFETLLGLATTWLIGLGVAATAAPIVAAVGIAAISAGAYLLANKLFATDVDANKLRYDKQNPTISGLRNVYPEAGAALPMVFGRVNVAPMKSAAGYTRMIGQRAYRLERMTWGPGPIALESLKIGTTSITNFRDVKIQFRNVDETQTRAAIPDLDLLNVTFLNDSDPMTLYATDIYEDADGARLEEDVRLTRTTAPGTQKANVRFYFDGLVRISDENEKLKRRVKIGIYYRVAGSSDPWTTHSEKFYRSKTTSTYWCGEEITFPSVGEWDVSLIRLSADSNDTQVKDDSYLAAIQSIAPGALPSPAGVAEIAIQIRATNQISGQLDPINGVVQRLLPVWDGAAFGDPEPTRHPADAYVHLLRGPQRKHPVPDAGIDLATIKAWKDAWPTWTYDYVTTGDVRLAELNKQVLACGLVVPTLRDGKHSIITDKSDQPPQQLLTPRNASGFQFKRNLPPEVHGLRIMFFSEDAGWEEDELVVYANGYDALSANDNYIETISVPGMVRAAADEITNVARFARYHLAQVYGRLEEVTLTVDLQHLAFGRGDPVIFTTDVLRNSYGDGRIADIEVSGADIVAVTLDHVPDLTDGTPVFISVRGSDGMIQHFEAEKAGSGFTGVASSGVRDWPLGSFTVEDIAPGDLATIYEVETEATKWLAADIATDFREQATLTLVQASTAPLDDLDAPLPDYTPRLLPTYEPLAPRYQIEYAGGDMVIALFWSMLNAQGEQEFRCVVEDVDGNPVGTYVGADKAARFAVQALFAESFVARIAAKTPSGKWGREVVVPISTATEFGPPNAVAGFGTRVVGDAVALYWDTGATNIDYYIVRFSPATTAASWASATPIVAKARGETVTVPARNGTYLIKGVTLQGAEATEASLAVVTSVAHGFNAVATLTLDPTFDGVLDDGLAVVGGELIFASANDLTTIPDLVVIDNLLTFGRDTLSAIYTPSDVIDLGQVDTARVAVNIEALAYYSGFDLRLEDDLLLLPDLLGGADGQWAATVQIATTDDDPSGTPTWSGWSNMVVGDYRARAYKFQVLLDVFSPQVLVKITGLDITVDMNDRIEKGADLTCTVSGYTVAFTPPFRAAPSIAIDGQGMATGDYWRVTAKSKAGFTVTFYDNTDTAVERVFDFIAVSYGRED